MARLRVSAVMLCLGAISLSACAPASGANGPGPDTHNAGYQRGYQAGREARLVYGTRPGSTFEDLVAHCDELAYRDIQHMTGDLVTWSEGFSAGCQSPLR